MTILGICKNVSLQNLKQISTYAVYLKIIFHVTNSSNQICWQFRPTWAFFFVKYGSIIRNRLNIIWTIAENILTRGGESWTVREKLRNNILILGREMDMDREEVCGYLV